MKVIGITGKSGSGKTTFAILLSKKLKCKYIDIDKIGHEATFRSEVLETLCSKFGNGILDEDGNLNRKKIGEIVFTQNDKMKELTDITWDFMQQRIDSILLHDDEVIILDWILLPNSKYWGKCDYKILVTSDDVARKNKVIKRDNITEEYFNKRDSASIDYSRYKFDYVLKNDYQEQTMNKMLDCFIEQYREKD